MNAARASFALSALALFVALGGGAVALQGKNSVNSGDIKDNTVKGKDVKAKTLEGKDFADDTIGAVKLKADTLTGDEIDEGSLSLPGLQRGAGEVVLDGGSSPLFDEVVVAETPAGPVEVNCSGAPTLEFTNETGADATVIGQNRAIVFEDDGVPGNGAVGMYHDELPDGNAEHVSLNGPGGLGWAELAAVAGDTVVVAEARVFAGASGCEYVTRVEYSPAA